MEHLSIKKEEIIAFGDEENDLPMFEAAGFSAAPFNAKENVKAKADLVVGSNAEDGVAAFLEEFFGL
jgi:hydroxymethylpyrimidine pyrophosphatase-like HAD family hydrolase